MQKQNYSRKLLSVLLAFVMLFSMMSVGTMSFASAAAKKVTVSKVQVTNLTNKVFYVAKGKIVKLATKVTVTPNKAANKKVSYKSKSTKIATVSSKGVVKGKKVGTTKITVTSKSNKSKKTTITVKVTNPVTSVKLNKKTATLTVGGKTTLSATVSPKKATKNVKWTSSNTKVATVSAKGVVTAKAAGTVTITAKAIDGTNKKAACKVTVKKKATAPTNVVDITSVSIFNPKNSSSTDTLLVTLSAAKPLKKADFTVKCKKVVNGKYNRTFDVESIYTTDNKNYKVTLENSLSSGYYYSVTVNALNGVKTKETFFKTKGKNYEQLITKMVGDKLSSTGITFSNMIGYHTDKIESGTLPKGIKFDSKNSYLSGTFEECANNKKVVFSATDELGTVSKTTVNFLVGDNNTICAQNKTVGADIYDKIYTYEYISWLSLYAVGGSGDYDMSLVDDYDGLFYLQDGGNNYTYIFNNSSRLTKAGTYNVQVKFTDKNNPELTAIGTATIIVSPTVAVKNVVKNIKNDTRTIYYQNRDTGDEFKSGNYANNETTVNVPVGTYDVYFKDRFDEIVILKTALKITADTTVQLDMPNLYTVSVKATNNNIPLQSYNSRVRIYDGNDNFISDTSVTNGIYTFSSILEGKYKIELAIFDIWKNDYVTIHSSSITVTSTSTSFEFSANYKITSTPSPDYIMTDVGTNTISENNYGTVVAFTPSETATYKIYSSDASKDPYCYVYNTDYQTLAYDDDNGEGWNFSLSIELTAGQTYYLSVKDYSQKSFVLNIEKK